MANTTHIQSTYDWMDDMFRRGLGEHADITCAFYNGNYSLTLEEAQTAKHEYMLTGIKFEPGMRVLDIGCGWGPFLKVVQEKGGKAVGLTLSKAQVETCTRNGLEAYLLDWKNMDPQKLGQFDAVVSVGAFEHFCSVEEYKAGKQDEIYRKFFDLCQQLLPPHGGLFLQTMVWNHTPDYDKISFDAPKDSDYYLMACLEKFYPGSWLPSGKEQVVKNAQNFKLISANSGRLDYIKTMDEWKKKTRRLTPALLWGRVRLIPKYLTDKDFRIQIESLYNEANKKMFERNIMEHYRMLFEKI